MIHEQQLENGFTMFKLIVTSFDKAQDILDTRWPTRAISLISPTEDRCYKRGDHHLLARFDDCTEDCRDEEGRWWTAPTRADIETILRFSEEFGEEDRVLIHCTAGKSRSTAIAIGVLVQHGMSPQDALAHVCTLRDVVIPNETITRYIDDILELDGELIAVVDKQHEKFPIIGGAKR